MQIKLGYKPFEYICDLAIQHARERTWESFQALMDAQERQGWPWCMTQEQMDDWDALHRRLDSDPTPPRERS